ncbi:MAG: dipeptide ABC transporter ATP-binding protein [Alphaproteobacteria bacterium]|nr:dipeptide ABC transporter ATP-binding protein [Alphaproteobacteria bacterium]
MTADALVAVDRLVKHFPVRKGFFRSKQTGVVRAVDDISFTIARGETLGLVGESGCGKSTTGRLLIRLIEPTSGAIRLDGDDLARLEAGALRARRRDVQIIFQDPFSSLNPRKTVGGIVAEPLIVHGIGDREARRARVAELLRVVGLAPEHADRYPHEFSGGQRQRIGIARALALNPKFIVCDEPVSALDASIQAQIINLMQDLQRELALTYLFISHNLAVVRHIADRVAVMYLGKIVELADKVSLYEAPKHPYTRALLSAIPVPDPDQRRRRIMLTGDVPSPIDPPQGCRFHTRCPHAEPRCRAAEPRLADTGGGHHVACHLVAPA